MLMAEPLTLDRLEICLIVDCGVWDLLDMKILNINNRSQIQTYNNKPPELKCSLLAALFLLSPVKSPAAASST